MFRAEFVKAKGEIKLTFSSTLGAGAGGGATSNGVERSMKVESRETSNSATLSTASHADLADPDDIVSEFLGQINHAAMAADGPPLIADGSGYDNGHRQQRRPLNGVHDGPHTAPDGYVDGSRLPASFMYESDSKLQNYSGGGVDGDLLPVGLSGAGGGDMGGGPAAETLKKMAALHRRLEENTGSGSTDQLLSSSDYDHGYSGGRHALYAAPSYQLPVSYCTGNSRCGMMYSAGASKPLSHYPATAVPATLPMAFPQYGHQAPEPEATGAGGTGSAFYMTQSQCVDFRLSHPVVQARTTMSQSAAVRSASPYRAQTPSSAAGWTRVGYPYPQPRYPSADDRSGWISSPYNRLAARNSSASTTLNGSENQRRVLHAYRGNQEQSFAVVTGGEGGLQPPPPYSDFVRQKQRLQFDRKWNQPTAAESRWRRQPWTRHHDFARTGNPGVAATPAPIPASGHVTSADVEFAVAGEPLSQEFFDAYSSSHVTIDNSDLSFIDDIFNGP